MIPSKQRLKLSVLIYSYSYLKIKFPIPTNQLVHCRVMSMENLSLEYLVGSHFTLWIGIFPPNITTEHWRRRRRRGGRRGILGLELGENNNNIHRGCCRNYNWWEAGKGDFLGGGVSEEVLVILWRQQKWKNRVGVPSTTAYLGGIQFKSPQRLPSRRRRGGSQLQ